MANRIVLNETSYHGAGAIQEIANEAKARGFKKAFVCSDPDLIKFNVTCKVTKVLEDAGLAYEIYSNIKPTRPSRTYRPALRLSRHPEPTISLPLAAVPPWIPQRQSALSSPTLNSRM